MVSYCGKKQETHIGQLVVYVSRHGETFLNEKNSSLKRKIRLQASEHAQDIEKYKAMIDEMKLRERHRELVF